MEDKQLLEMLMEGGNARFIDRKTGEVAGFADKMDLKQIPRNILVDEVILVLNDINDLFQKKTGEKLWKDFNVITSGKALNGSSSSLFNKDITDEEFVTHKPKVGDIDITFPGEHMGALWELLNEIEKKKLGKMTTYLGHKNSNMNPQAAANQAQINAIFEIDAGNYKVNAQIDFEGSEYDKKTNSPTDWASFSHNSDWADIKEGFKGVAHKFTLLNLARAHSKLEGVKIVTETIAKKINGMTKEEYEAGKPVKASTSQKYANPTNMAFSVAKGIRNKFTPVFFKDGKDQLTIDGAPVFVEIPTSDSKYETELEKLFELIFQVEPKGSDMKDFNSFVGLVKLMKKYSSKQVIEDFFFEQLVSKTLWCASGCQGLERNNPQGDLEIKSAMVNHLYDNFPYLKSYQSKVDAAAEEYYKNYKMLELSEGFIPHGSKFSDIFEAVETVNENINLEPRGWRHFDSERLASEKIKVLKHFDVSETDIINFMNSMPNSRYVNDVIRKISPTRGMEDFLRHNPYEKTVTQQMLDKMIKRGY